MSRNTGAAAGSWPSASASGAPFAISHCLIAPFQRHGGRAVSEMAKSMLAIAGDAFGVGQQVKAALDRYQA
jgi:hypothetical protein